MEMKYCHLKTSGDGTAARPDFTQRFTALTHTHGLINSIKKRLTWPSFKNSVRTAQ